MIRHLLCALILGAVTGAALADDSGASVAAVTSLSTRFAEAQRNFDVATLRAITADNYLEISPAGEFDSRDKMLSFYTADKQVTAPPVVTELEQTRLFGDVAVQSVKYNYTVPGADAPRQFAIRGTLVAHKVNGVWKMVSAHYTGVRPSAKPH